MWIEELIEIAESEASCELYGILKRPDEKYVTERAYDNPKFVEDMVRDVAVRLNDEARIAAYVVESENFESIHNHSAYALIERDKDADDRLLTPSPAPCDVGGLFPGYRSVRSSHEIHSPSVAPVASAGADRGRPVLTRKPELLVFAAAR